MVQGTSRYDPEKSVVQEKKFGGMPGAPPIYRTRRKVRKMHGSVEDLYYRGWVSREGGTHSTPLSCKVESIVPSMLTKKGCCWKVGISLGRSSEISTAGLLNLIFKKK